MAKEADTQNDEVVTKPDTKEGTNGADEATQAAKAETKAKESAPDKQEAKGDTGSKAKAKTPDKIPHTSTRQEKARKNGDVEVKDKAGNILFVRKASTKTEPVHTKVKAKDHGRTATRKLTKPDNRGIHTNPTYLNFPTDKWGVTKDVKKSMITMASRIAGDKAKYDLAMATLKILAGHLQAKYDADSATRNARELERAAKESN